MKKQIIVFVVGLVLGCALTAFGASKIITNMKAQLISPIANTSDSVKWIAEHPAYADAVKKSYDKYMNAAQQAFEQTITVDSVGK